MSVFLLCVRQTTPDGSRYVLAVQAHYEYLADHDAINEKGPIVLCCKRTAFERLPLDYRMTVRFGFGVLNERVQRLAGR